MRKHAAAGAPKVLEDDAILLEMGKSKGSHSPLNPRRANSISFPHTWSYCHARAVQHEGLKTPEPEAGCSAWAALTIRA